MLFHGPNIKIDKNVKFGLAFQKNVHIPVPVCIVLNASLYLD